MIPDTDGLFGALTRTMSPTMRTYLVAYAATLAVFLLGDFVWLGTVALSFYRSRLGALLLDKPNLATAAGFYVLQAAIVACHAGAGTAEATDWPRIAASASMPPTPQPSTPRPLTIVVCESVPTQVSG